LTVVSGVVGEVGVVGVVAAGGVLSLPPPQAVSTRVITASAVPAASRRGVARKQDERGFIGGLSRGWVDAVNPADPANGSRVESATKSTTTIRATIFIRMRDKPLTADERQRMRGSRSRPLRRPLLGP
jgi:hypothetical protein